MIMEQVVRGNKRDVVDGQFEDPGDDDGAGAKRLKLTVEVSTVSKQRLRTAPSIVPPQIPLAPLAPTPVAAASSTWVSPSSTGAPVAPPVRPPPVTTVSVGGTPTIPPPNGAHPPNGIPPSNGMPPWMMNPASMAAWQHQQQAFMMGRMFAMMQQPQSQMMNPQQMMRMLPSHMPPPGWIPTPGMPPNSAPPSVYPYPQQQQQQQQQSRPAAAAIPPARKHDEGEWRIPYSHNYHPRTGSAQKRGSPVKSKEAHPEPPKNLPPLTEEELSKPLNFPLVKEDEEKQFGLKNFELTKKDVLCGRGGVTNAHEGNIRYRSVVDQYRWHYASAKKSRKSDVARIIVRKIRADHGRFLKKDGQLWYEIGDEAALSKAAQTLREGLAKIYREGLRAKMGEAAVEEEMGTVVL